MHKTTENEGYTGRLLDVKTLCKYLNMGRGSAVQFARQIGADRRFGRRCLYDRTLIDAALNGAGSGQQMMARE